MKRAFDFSSIGVASLSLAMAFLTMAGSAWAEASTHCVKATKAGKKYTGGFVDKNCTAPSAKHEGKYEFIRASSLSEPEQEELKALLKYVKVVPAGVAGKPTVQVSGANVQIVSGAGKTNAAVNGEGNLVIGYDEKPGTQTGSHDLILGEEQTFTSFAGILAGRENKISGEFASVTGGLSNSATERFSSVSGGEGNKATGRGASVSGGLINEASARGASVSGGGEKNTASGEVASVTGGINNAASGSRASVTGGAGNTASGETASVSGGNGNTASAQAASVSGGHKSNANALATSVSGGFENKAGVELEKGSFAWVGGGAKNIAEGNSSSVFGGNLLKAEATFEALPACVAPGKAGELC